MSLFRRKIQDRGPTRQEKFEASRQQAIKWLGMAANLDPIRSDDFFITDLETSLRLSDEVSRVLSSRIPEEEKDRQLRVLYTSDWVTNDQGMRAKARYLGNAMHNIEEHPDFIPLQIVQLAGFAQDASEYATPEQRVLEQLVEIGRDAGFSPQGSDISWQPPKDDAQK